MESHSCMTYVTACSHNQQYCIPLKAGCLKALVYTLIAHYRYSFYIGPCRRIAGAAALYDADPRIVAVLELRLNTYKIYNFNIPVDLK